MTPWKYSWVTPLALFLAMPASAQQATIPNVVTGKDSNGGQKTQAVGNGTDGYSVPMPVAGTGGGGASVPTSPGTVVALGQQTISSATLATAQPLTLPTGATIADFYPEGTGGTNNNCVRFRDDGTAPTASVGSPLQPGQLLLGYTGKPNSASASLTSIQFILATGATCTLTINYYK